MAEPIREQILAQVSAILRDNLGGTRTWGGQYVDAPSVGRQWFELGPTVTTFPAVIVSAGSGSTMPMETTAGDAVGFVHNFRVAIYGYVKGDDTTLASTWLQRLQEDVIGILLLHQTLNGTCRELYIENDETDDGLLEPFGGFRQNVLVVADDDRITAL